MRVCELIHEFIFTCYLNWRLFCFNYQQSANYTPDKRNYRIWFWTTNYSPVQVLMNAVQNYVLCECFLVFYMYSSWFKCSPLLALLYPRLYQTRLASGPVCIICVPLRKISNCSSSRWAFSIKAKLCSVGLDPNPCCTSPLLLSFIGALSVCVFPLE